MCLCGIYSSILVIEGDVEGEGEGEVASEVGNDDNDKDMNGFA